MAPGGARVAPESVKDAYGFPQELDASQRKLCAQLAAKAVYRREKYWKQIIEQHQLPSSAQKVKWLCRKVCRLHTPSHVRHVRW